MRKSGYLLLALLVSLTACARLTNPFSTMRADYTSVPEASLNAFASAVEQAVLEGNRTSTFDGYDGVASANEEILQAVHTRAARSELIQALLNSGHAYEQAQGTICILRTRDYKLQTSKKQRDQNALLVMSENANRWTLYEGLCKASNWQRKSLGAVQASFFQARVQSMSAGQKYEAADGKIAVK